MNIFPFLNEPFKAILLGIYSIVGNYGWSIVIFTLLIRLVLIPFDTKSRRSMRKTQKLQPQLAALQTKYKNDKEKLNQKTMELYRKEKISPLSGCLPMLLTLPISVRHVRRHEHPGPRAGGWACVYLSGREEPQYQGWLWVKHLDARQPFRLQGAR
jgi:YidC/Oxa1 family membrane protein insertase